MEICAGLSVMALMTLPLGPVSLPILSTGTLMVNYHRGGVEDSFRQVYRWPQPSSVVGGRPWPARVLSKHLRRGSRRAWCPTLQRSDEVLSPGDLEVHVTERVFGAEDVGEGDEATLLTPSTAPSSECRRRPGPSRCRLPAP